MAEYKDLANKRLIQAIKYINMVANMTKSRNYTVTEEEVTKILERLELEVEKINLAFQSRTKKSKEIEDVL